MLSWPLAVARASGLFDTIVVSTDDDEIATLATAHGAEVPFRRPAALADDHAGTEAVMQHALGWWEANRGPVTLLCCLYPTAPFLRAEDLRAGRDLLLADPTLEYAISVTTFPFPIFRALRRDPTGRLGLFWPENENARSQDLPEAWHDAAQFYWGRPAAWRAGTSLFSSRALGLPLPRHRVQDIDTHEDWDRAEALAPVLLGPIRKATA
jgi:N-acylneuraminate cytidylyltransferase